MRAPLTIAAAALALLTGAPGASALTLQTQSDHTTLDTTVPNDPPSPVMRQNLRGQPAEDQGVTTHIGNSTVHFGMSRGSEPSGGNQWFLDSPASRTVPSQAR